MKLIYKHHQTEKVGLYQSILENSGIPSVIKNQFISAAIGTWLTDPETPELWVLNDTDYEAAFRLIQNMEKS